MKYLEIIRDIYLFLWVLYIMYKAVMNIVRVHNSGAKIHPFAKLFHYPTIFIFLILDWLLNMIMSVFYLELPKTLFELFTARLTRWHDTDGYRGKFSRWFAINLLDDYDHRGYHVPGDKNL